MKSVWQLFLGLLAAAATTVLVIAAASLALVEDTTSAAMLPSPAPSVTTAAGAPLTPNQTVSPTLTLTAVQPTACTYPQGWEPYAVLPGDTLDSLAEQYGLTVEEIMKGNCMRGTNLFGDTYLYLPSPQPTNTVPSPLPTFAPTQTSTQTPTITVTRCGPPSGWVPYIVQPGDTLFRLSLILNISQDMLREANCMTGTALYTGQTLWVPYIPVRTPVPTHTSTPKPPTNTPIPPTSTKIPATATSTAVPATAIPTATLTPTETMPSSAPTETIEPTLDGQTGGGIASPSPIPNP